MTKDELITLLKDDEIKKIIKDIVKDDKYSDSLNLERDREIEELRESITNYQEEIRVLKELADKFKRLFNNQESDNINLKKENERLKEELERYRNICDKEIKIYQMYQNLPDNIKASLKGIFKDDSFKGFIACGVQEKSIVNFWEYLKNEIIEGRKSNIDNLIEIFNFLFERFLLAYPIYKREQVEIGEEFDTQRFINADSTTPSGRIKEVILFGWINEKTGKIVKKSIVRI